MTQKNKRNVWIFGATGYIGSALLHYLSNHPENRMHLLIHKKNNYRFLESFNTITGSIGDIEPFWFERYPPDVVFHLARPAGSSFLTRSIKALQGEKANERLAKMLAGIKKPPIVVYVSGSLMYGRRTADDPAHEESPISPDSFGKHYILNERPWLEAQAKGILDVRFARPGWIIGPGSWFLHYFWKPYLQSGFIPCYGDGSHPMSLIHVEDGAAMIDTLSKSGEKGQNLNLFTGKIITHINFCEAIAGVLGAEIRMIPFAEMKKRFGNATAQALVSSTPMITKYPHLHQKSQILYPDAESILRHVTGLLKNI